MADLSYDQFATNVRATYPNLDEGAIKSAYSSQYGGDAVRTAGPDLATFRSNVKAQFPDLADEAIAKTYQDAYGSGFGTSLKRAATSAFAHGAEFSSALAGKLGEFALGPKAADEMGQGAFDYWKGVEERNQPARALQGNVIDNPGLLTNPGFYGEGLGGLAGTLANPAFYGAQRATDLYDQGKLSGPKAVGLGAAETVLGMTPLTGPSRLINALYGGGIAAGFPALEAASTGESVPEALKAGLGAVPFGMLAGATVPGRPMSIEPQGGTAGVNDFMARAREAAGVAPGTDVVPTNAVPPAPEPPPAAPPPAPIDPAAFQSPPLDPLSGPLEPEPPPPAPVAPPPPVNLAPEQLAASQTGLNQALGHELALRQAGIGPDLPPRPLGLPAPAPSGEFAVTPGGNVTPITEAQSAANAATRAATNARLDTLGLGESARIAQRMLENRRANPPPEAGIVNPIDPAAAPEVKIAQLNALTEQNKPLVRSTIQAISQALPGTTSEDSVKAPSTMLEKIGRPETKVNKPWMGLEHIRDSYRFRTAIDSGTQLEALPDLLAKQGFQVVKVDTGKFFHGNPWGWRMAALDLRAPNGQIIEWYTTFKPILDYSNGEGHAIYEKWRNTDPATLSAADRAQFEEDRLKSQAANRELFAQSIASSGQSRQALADSLTTFARKAGLMTGIQPSRLPRTPSADVRSLQPSPEALMRQGAPPPGSTITAPSASRASTSGAVSTPPSIPARPTHGPNELIAPGGRKVAVQPALVELSDLIHSQRPNYDAALQPRDRTRQGSDTQVDEMAQRPNLAKTKILIDHRGQVVSGNGRILAQLRMDTNYPDNAAQYTRELEAAGHDIAGMHRPILVDRITHPTEHGDLVNLAQEMNANTRLAMSSAETSLTDAGKLDTTVLAQLHPGPVEGTANAGFVRSLLGKFSKVQRAAFLDADGNLSADGIRRINNAIMARAYGGTARSKAVLLRAMESSDNEVRSITGAMQDAAPVFADLREQIKGGNVPAEYDTTGDLTEAVELVAKMRAAGRSLTETLGQVDAFNPRSPETEAFMRAFYNGARPASRQLIANRLSMYASEAAKQDVNQGDLLGSSRPSAVELIDQAAKSAGAERAPPLSQDLFLQVAQPARAYRGKGIQSSDGQASFDFGDFETRPDTLPRQLGAAHGALTELLNYRDRGGQVSVLANRLTQDFTRTGTTTLVGQKIGSAADLAALAQVYRDPRFETLRFLTVDKDGRITSHFGHTSRLPGSVNFSIDIGVLARELNASGNAGFYMLHNHPLGSAKPSVADVSATRQVAEQFPWLRGHVVIDHNEYAEIQPSGDYQIIKHAFGGYDPNANPKVPHRLLDTRITKMEQVASLGAQLQARSGFVTLVAMTDDARVGAIAEYPTSLLTQGLTTAARIRTLQRQSGSGNYVFAIAAPADLKALDPLVMRGVISATVEKVGTTSQVGKIFGRHNMLSDRRKSYLAVGQEQTPLEEDGRFAPGAENEIGGGTYKLRQFSSLEPAELEILAGVVENLDGPVASQRRGERSWNVTEEAALKLIQAKYGITLDQLVNRKKGSTANAEQLEAYAQIISATSKEIRKLAEEVVATGSHESKVALAAAKDKLGMLLAPALGYQTEAGRALNILRKTAAANQEAARLLDILGDGSDAALTDFAKRVRKAGNLDQVIGITRNAYTPTWWDKFYEGWMAAILSGPTTHAVNITSNALFQVMDLTADTLATPFAGTGAWRQLQARLQGMGHGSTIGLMNMRKAFVTEEPQIGAHLQTQHPNRAIGGKLGRAIRYPLRALTAEDEFFKGPIFHGELTRLAMERAQNEKAPDVWKRAAEIMGNIQNDPELQEQAMQAAQRGTFQSDLGAFGTGLLHLLQKVPVLKLIIPFVRTPTNIVKQAIEFSPGAPAFESVREALSGGKGQRAAAQAWSRITIGTGIMLSMVALAMKGLVSGNGPNNPDERALLMRQGWQPYSIKVGGKWYKYNRIDPIGTLLGFAADMHDIIGYAKPGEYDKMGSAAVTSIALNLGDKTFLRGITDFSQAYADPQQYLERWAQGMAGSVVPNLAAQVARGNDPFMRQTDTLLDAIKAKIPGMRETLTKKLDIAGDPINQTGDFPGNPFPGQAQNQDRLADAMLRLSVNKGKPQKSIDYLTRSVQLTPEEYQEYAGMVQQARWKVLTPMVSSPQFQQAMQQAPDLAAKLLGDQWDAIGNAMKVRYLYTHPAIIQRLAEPKAPRSGSPYAQEANVP